MKKRYKVLIIILSIVVVGFIAGMIVINKLEKNLEALNTATISDIDMNMVADGNYNGSYSVFPVTVEVSVLVKDHKIEDITIIKHDNGKGKPAEAIINDVIEQQSLDVDVITGATYSSRVILLAIEDALLSANQ